MHETPEAGEREIFARMETARIEMTRLKNEIFEIDAIISISNSGLGSNEQIKQEWAHMQGGVVVEANIFGLADACIAIIESKHFSGKEKEISLGALEDYVARLRRSMDEFRESAAKIIKE